MGNWKRDQGSFLERAKGLYQAKAQRIAQSKEKLQQLIQKVSDKLQRFADNPTVKDAKFYLEVVIRMLKAYYKNEYRAFSNKTLVLLVLGLLYFLIPFDFIPDFIAGLGFVDDLSVLLAIVKSIQGDIVAFLEWERTKA